LIFGLAVRFPDGAPALSSVGGHDPIAANKSPGRPFFGAGCCSTAATVRLPVSATGVFGVSTPAVGKLFTLFPDFFTDGTLAAQAWVEVGTSGLSSGTGTAAVSSIAGASGPLLVELSWLSLPWDCFPLVPFCVGDSYLARAGDVPASGVAWRAWSNNAANLVSFFADVAPGTLLVRVSLDGGAAWIAIGTEYFWRPLLGNRYCAEQIACQPLSMSRDR
jgi:hypothetical protein